MEPAAQSTLPEPPARGADELDPVLAQQQYRVMRATLLLHLGEGFLLVVAFFIYLGMTTGGKTPMVAPPPPTVAVAQTAPPVPEVRELTFRPTADVCVSKANASEPINAAELSVSPAAANGHTTYLRFDITGIGSGHVKAVKLRLHELAGPAGVSANLLVERGLPSGNPESLEPLHKIRKGGILGALIEPPPAQPTWVEIGLNPGSLSQDGPWAIVLWAPSGNAITRQFDSSESASPPELVITLETEPSP